MPPAMFLIPLNNKPAKPDKLSRKWLNWVYTQNKAITTSSEVRTNLDYYHEMIKNHYNYLLQKKQNSVQIKKSKKKVLTIISGINAAFWSSMLYFIVKETTISAYDYYSSKNTHYDFWAFMSGILAAFTSIPNIALIYSYLKYDRVLNSHLQRDEDMLRQFEEYKATHTM
ncbi:hypothetical protein Noda2021_09570 [Candidatus Dependentiae bacterium Noda2021]|nr:hypothetical protein Noda2021_09570 [Candidatus Dependentiae bacterium Noda2021]